jgi:hypothetical protein
MFAHENAMLASIFSVTGEAVTKPEPSLDEAQHTPRNVLCHTACKDIMQLKKIGSIHGEKKKRVATL